MQRVATTTPLNAEHISVEIRFGPQIALSAEWIYTNSAMKGGSPHILNLRWTATDEEQMPKKYVSKRTCPYLDLVLAQFQLSLGSDLA